MVNYQDMSKEELLMEIEKLKKQKKYGLIWEQHNEGLNFNAIPLLKEIEEKEINLVPNQKPNLLIEGDNYYALKSLQYTHKGLIDVIYIDPPYNTGNKDFVYNDSFVDSEDGFRHSKWLSFMEKRLKLAKDLLSNDGIIFISIDDNEYAQLKILCDEVFGERNFISNIIWKNRTSKQYSEKFISKQTDYILCYAKSKKYWFDLDIQFNKILDKSKYSNYKNPDNDKNGAWLSSGIIRDDGRKKYTVISPSGKEFTEAWLYTEENFHNLDKEGKLWWGVNNDSKPRKKSYLKDFLGEVSSNLIDIVSNEMASKNLKELFNGNTIFSYPKPVQLIKYLLNLHPNKNSIVLDFFAGSGTTGHAVMELNKEDGGNRQFILCTNNEVSDDKSIQKLIELGKISNKKDFKEFKDTNEYIEFIQSNDYLEMGIARQVTYQRLSKVINGYTTPKGVDVDGITNNLKYYIVDGESLDINAINMYKFNKLAIDSLLLKYNGTDLISSNDYYSIYNTINNKDLVLLHDVNYADELLEELDKNMDYKFILFAKSDDSYEMTKMEIEEEHKNSEFHQLPKELLELYRRINNK